MKTGFITFIVWIVCLSLASAKVLINRPHDFKGHDDKPPIQWWPWHHQEQGDNWAVLIAGSRGWWNYRHQADIYHAYHILRRNGFREERIIVMHYDDIAHNIANPFPGVVVNHPNGGDVYDGVPADYTGSDVTAETLVKVLLGDQDAVRGVGTGRVLQSGPHDRIFINFVDHGTVGAILMPDGKLMSAKLLLDTLEQMKERGMFDTMVFYLEACESGSMWENLRTPGVYAVSSADATHSSFACYYDAKLGTFLGDVFSVKWMETLDYGVPTSETIEQIYETAKNLTQTSTVLEFGDKDIQEAPLSKWLTAGKPGIESMKNAPPVKPIGPHGMNSLDSRKVKRTVLLSMFLDAVHRHLDTIQDAAAQLTAYYSRVDYMKNLRDATSRAIMDLLYRGDTNDNRTGQDIQPSPMDCTHYMHAFFMEHCGTVQEEDLEFLSDIARTGCYDDDLRGLTGKNGEFWDEIFSSLCHLEAGEH
eukprot:Clim_evm16s225 gene=Clim_evmTU16s225